MQQLRSVRPHEYNIIMLWAICCICFFRFTAQAAPDFDQSLHMSITDVAVDCPIPRQTPPSTSQDGLVRGGHIRLPGENQQEVLPNCSPTYLYPGENDDTWQAIP